MGELIDEDLCNVIGRSYTAVSRLLTVSVFIVLCPFLRCLRRLLLWKYVTCLPTGANYTLLLIFNPGSCGGCFISMLQQVKDPGVDCELHVNSHCQSLSSCRHLKSTWLPRSQVICGLLMSECLGAFCFNSRFVCNCICGLRKETNIIFLP